MNRTYSYLITPTWSQIWSLSIFTVIFGRTSRFFIIKRRFPFTWRSQNVISLKEQLVKAIHRSLLLSIRLQPSNHANSSILESRTIRLSDSCYMKGNNRPTFNEFNMDWKISRNTIDKIVALKLRNSIWVWGFRIPSLEPLITSQQLTQLSILSRAVNEYSEVTLRTNTGHTLITANLKLKCFIQYKDSSLPHFMMLPVLLKLSSSSLIL